MKLRFKKAVLLRLASIRAHVDLDYGKAQVFEVQSEVIADADRVDVELLDAALKRLQEGRDLAARVLAPPCTLRDDRGPAAHHAHCLVLAWPGHVDAGLQAPTVVNRLAISGSLSHAKE